MKKTLAILLALVMSASVALVACDNANNNNEDDNDDFVIDFGGDVVNGETTAPETDENGETIEPAETNNNNGGNNNGGSTTMETVSDTVYVLYTANIREEASDKNSVDIVGKADFGVALTRSAKNSKWSKVSFTPEGASTPVSGYIANDLITTNAKTVNFIEQKVTEGEGENQTTSPVITKIKSTLRTQNAVIRNFPLADGVPNEFKVLDTDDFNSTSIISQIPKGTENITVIAVSEDGVWAKVKGMGFAYNNGNPSTTATEVTGYTLYSNLEIAGSGSSGGNSGAIG